MTGLNDREKAFEDKYAHDEELRFKVTARRNKLFGLWAAEQLSHSDAETYAKNVVMSDFAEPGDDDVLRKVLADFEDAGVEMTREKLRAEMDTLMRIAMDQIMGEI